MKSAKLDREEKEVLESFERGEWVSIRERKAEVSRLGAAARATLRKSRRINIRLSDRDVIGLQAKDFTFLRCGLSCGPHILMYPPTRDVADNRAGHSKLCPDLFLCECPLVECVLDLFNHFIAQLCHSFSPMQTVPVKG